ncbi:MULTISPECIES: hypothetical protein [Paenibacillus]|uniref:Uncharacterized protein n=2 Tax=Paenibacillus TaxID=44249 RepID=A0ABX2ZBK1_PAEPO|nr:MULTISPECIES: hypothetical protein [Paenibacillus]MDR6779497.1 hypothetical protein [Paenibacillus peoriae]ODA08234.1 hypothetical protein A7312_27905 [Paenibacillus polymyxa]
MWRKMFKFFGAKVIYTVDYDGEVRIRFANKLSYDRWTCYELDKKVVLFKDGSSSGKYIKNWGYL